MSYPVWQPGSGRNPPSMLAAQADRERAADVLRAGYGEGRLDHAEFENRVARAYAARTVGELSLLVADLPQGPASQSGVPVAQVPGTFLPRPAPANAKAVASMVCGALCLVTLGVTGVPAVVLGHVARSEIRRSGEGGDGYALVGLALGWVSVAGWALVMVLFSLVLLVSGSA